MALIHSFAPIVGSHARILILGSMPGTASLAANQYYAHRRNAFWPIMTSFLRIQADAPYHEKVAALQSSPIALWDVLQSCKRSGSLDSSIEIDTQSINDFQTFFSNYPTICYIFFNGSKAEACFKRFVPLTNDVKSMNLSRLPSTSPANARLSLEDKFRIWHKTINQALAIDHPLPETK
ncbi:DNA-deoxyinosine glycosylase [Nitrosomonas sp.]|uniref:DNA-deoxyinosine glycosylase n=1 Tax=Nitrosomonas sp. TaxID=42353 RepID=UPI001DEA277F|nr:DNA-deoxyinosine glycosylase [Nitrosomonas sp.]MBX3617148.1 DNA-deoxyinosine glycosylase [Nitrosomonas sp.]